MARTVDIEASSLRLRLIEQGLNLKVRRFEGRLHVFVRTADELKRVPKSHAGLEIVARVTT
jgi:hypothetical protein